MQVFKEIGTCLYKLHENKITHKDIKGRNIVYSKEKQRFVLCDLVSPQPPQIILNNLVLNISKAQ